MIPVFRKTRKKMADDNRPLKYLRYAIGEIVLVVIGILIAVAINSKYQEDQNEKNIAAILVQVQNELLTDIKDAKRIFNQYIKVDSLTGNILNDRLTAEYIVENPVSFYFFRSYVSFSNKKTGYERLMENLESLPKKYTIILTYFNDLYREQQNEIDDYNEEIKATVYGNQRHELSTKTDAYLSYMNAPTENEAISFLADPFLKNRLVKFTNDFANITMAASLYRSTSIELYKKIDTLLGNQKTDYPELLMDLPDQKIIEAFLGEYQLVSDEANTFSLVIENNQLIVIHPIYGKTPIKWDGGDYYYMPEVKGVTKLYINEKGQHIRVFSNGFVNNVFVKTSDLKHKI